MILDSKEQHLQFINTNGMCVYSVLCVHIVCIVCV